MQFKFCINHKVSRYDDKGGHTCFAKKGEKLKEYFVNGYIRGKGKTTMHTKMMHHDANHGNNPQEFYITLPLSHVLKPHKLSQNNLNYYLYDIRYTNKMINL